MHLTSPPTNEDVCSLYAVKLGWKFRRDTDERLSRSIQAIYKATYKLKSMEAISWTKPRSLVRL